MMPVLALTSRETLRRAWVVPCLTAAMLCLGCPASPPPGTPSACRGDPVASAAAVGSDNVPESPELTEPASVAGGRHSAPAGRLFRFERNDGQADSRVKFLSRGRNYTLFLSENEAVFVLAGRMRGDAPPWREHVLRMQFAEGSTAAAVHGLDPLPGRSHYLIGRDPRGWHTDVPNYGRVLVQGIYPGIDVLYYGSPGHLEYDVIVAPGADPARLVIRFDGARSLRVDGDGSLLAEVGDGRLRLEKPVIYQRHSGGRRLVAGRYVVRPGGEAGVALGPYDRSRALVIDPVMVYATFLGGDDADQGESIVFDASGQAYVAGTTSSATFPTTAGACQRENHGAGDVFVTKLAADGSTVLYSTFLGGALHDQGRALAVNRDGEVYVTGTTASVDFPVHHAFQPAFGGGGGDLFVTKLNAQGSGAVFSTYLGGRAVDEGRGIAVDAAGDAYVTGATGSVDFRLVGAFQSAFGGGTDAFLVKLPASGLPAPIYATYHGGRGADVGRSIAVDAANRVVMTGTTDSPDFPLRNPIQTALGGRVDAFVTQFDATGTGLVYSTYLGGAQSDAGAAVAVGPAGSVYVTGDTTSSDFPVHAALQPARAGAIDAFVVRINPGGTAFLFSTYLGGTDIDIGRGIAVDGAGVAHVAGLTGSRDFPVRDPIQGALGGAMDAFVTRIKPDGSALLSSTYLGGSDVEYATGIAVDGTGGVAVVGQTASKDFPATPQAFRRAFNGGQFDAFVVKMTER
jgi:hypothetical protein